MASQQEVTEGLARFHQQQAALDQQLEDLRKEEAAQRAQGERERQTNRDPRPDFSQDYTHD